MQGVFWAKLLDSQGTFTVLHVGIRDGIVCPRNSPGLHRTYPEARLLPAETGADGVVLQGAPWLVLTDLQ